MTAALFITFAITAIMGFPIWIVLVLSCFAGIFLGGSATQCWLSPSGCLPPWIPSRCWPFLCSW